MSPRGGPLAFGLVPLLLAAAHAQEDETAPAAPVDRVAEFVLLADPAGDDWESEHWSTEAEALLTELADALVGDRAALERFVASPFAAADPRPDEGAETPRTGALSVRRHPPELFPADPAAAPWTQRPDAFFERLLAPFVGARDLGVSFEIEGIEPAAGAGFTTRVRYRARARVGAAAVQQDGFWSVAFARDDERGLRIVHIAPERLDEVRAERPLFAEATRGVLAGAGGSAGLAAFGSEHWRGRIDDVGEPNFWGHNGIAIGDVNGDDLDDIYVAMGTGIPNLLLVQQPDGTVSERAFEAGCAWLDDTKGVLLADMDGDGAQDLLCAIGPTIVLSLNDGTGRFTPARSLRAATDAAFYGMAVADYDLDGDLDIYAVRYVKASYGDSVPIPYHDARNGPRNHLLRNDGADGFRDVTDEVGLGVNNDRFSLAPCWTDYDNDGDPDLYVANDFGGNNLYRNDDGRFVDVAREALVLDLAAGMGTSLADVDGDGRFDLLVSNMYVPAGLRVATQARFHAANPELATVLRGHAMGNSLFLSRADGSFTDAGARAGIRDGGWSWGALFADFDGDGHEDMFVPNGFLSGPRRDDLSSYFWRQVATRSPVGDADASEYIAAWAATTELMDAGWSWSGRERNRAYLGLGDASFVDVSGVSGLDFIDDARAVALCDWDGDGAPDLWIKNRTGPALRFLHNTNRPPGGAVSIRLVGTTVNQVRATVNQVRATVNQVRATANTDAIGARVELRAGGRIQVRERRAGEGYLAQSSPWLVFPLGAEERVEGLSVRWPNGERQEFEGLAGGQRYRIVQGQPDPRPLPPRAVEPPPRGALVARAAPYDRVVLRTRLPLPPRLRRDLFEGLAPGRARLLLLFVGEEERALEELGLLAERSDELAAGGLDLRAVALGPAPARALAQRAFEERVAPRMQTPGFGLAQPEEETLALLETLTASVSSGWSAPGGVTGLLVDVEDNLALYTRGRIGVDVLLQDARGLGAAPGEVAVRASFPGVWFFGMPRNWEALAADLRARGLEADAGFYDQVARYQERRR